MSILWYVTTERTAGYSQISGWLANSGILATKKTEQKLTF